MSPERIISQRPCQVVAPESHLGGDIQKARPLLILRESSVVLPGIETDGGVPPELVRNLPVFLVLGERTTNWEVGLVVKPSRYFHQDMYCLEVTGTNPLSEGKRVLETVYFEHRREDPGLYFFDEKGMYGDVGEQQGTQFQWLGIVLRNWQRVYSFNLLSEVSPEAAREQSIREVGSADEETRPIDICQQESGPLMPPRFGIQLDREGESRLAALNGSDTISAIRELMHLTSAPKQSLESAILCGKKAMRVHVETVLISSQGLDLTLTVDGIRVPGGGLHSAPQIIKSLEPAEDQSYPSHAIVKIQLTPKSCATTSVQFERFNVFWDPVSWADTSLMRTKDFAFQLIAALDKKFLAQANEDAIGKAREAEGLPVHKSYGRQPDSRSSRGTGGNRYSVYGRPPIFHRGKGR